jgi:hypothetical protein
MEVIPTKLEEITPLWFSKVISGALVKPETFKIVPNVIGCLSILARVKFEAEFLENNESKEFNLIVKLVPDGGGVLEWAREIVMVEKLDQVEIHTYKTLLPDLIAEIPELRKYICDFHFAGIREADSKRDLPYASVIVMEDLTPQGYSTILYNGYFPTDEFRQGLDFLATFHVAGKAVEFRRKGTMREIYPWFPDWLNSRAVADPALRIPGVFTYFTDAFPKVYKFLAEYSKPSIIPILEPIEKEAVVIFNRIMEAGQIYPCVAHGDLFSHNILLNRTEPSKTIKIIDWQLIAYADPLFDLALYILTTLNVETLNPVAVSRAVRMYYEKYEELCMEKGLPLQRTADEFEKSFNTWGLAYGVICYVISVEPFSSVEGRDVAAKKIIHVFELLIALNVPKFMLSLLSV